MLICGGSGILIRVVGLSDIGLIRSRNEDSFLINKEAGIFIICDGMGGHKGGDVASDMAIKTITEELNKNADLDIDLINQAIRKANHDIWLGGIDNPDLFEMGTTLILAKISNKNLDLFHVGDSRAYLLRGNEIIQLTKDHTLAEKMRQKGVASAERESYNHILTRALGIEDKIEIDNISLDLQADDFILLCSDGLSDMLTDLELLEIIEDGHELDIMAHSLINKAVSKGGRDNITLILIQI